MANNKHLSLSDRINYVQQEYQELLSESRSGISISEEEAALLDATNSPLIKKGQSIFTTPASKIFGPITN